MRKVAGALVVAVVAMSFLFVSGCTIAKISGRGAVPLMLNNPPTKVQVVEHFTISKSRAFDYTGSYDVSEIIADKLAQSKADAVINLNVVLKTTVGNFFLDLITLGFASARTISIEGDLVKAPSGLGSILEDRTILAEVSGKKELAIAVDHLSASGATYSAVVQRNGKFLLIQ